MFHLPDLFFGLVFTYVSCFPLHHIHTRDGKISCRSASRVGPGCKSMARLKLTCQSPKRAMRQSGLSSLDPLWNVLRSWKQVKKSKNVEAVAQQTTNTKQGSLAQPESGTCLVVQEHWSPCFLWSWQSSLKTPTWKNRPRCPIVAS